MKYKEKLMKKKLSLQEKNDSNIVISWFGFNPSIYEFIEKNCSGTWLVNPKYGNCYRLIYSELSSLIPLFVSNQFEIENELVELSNINDVPKPTPKQSLVPRKYQLNFSKTMFEKKRILLSLDTGLGKTLTTILACTNIPDTILVVTPPTILLFWQAEISRVLPNASSVIWENKNKCQADPPPKFILITYDKLKIHDTYKLLLKEYKISTLIMDESQYIKSVTSTGLPGSLRAKACLYLANRVTYCYALSATPIPSKTLDIYNLLVCLKAYDIIGDSFYFFAQRYCDAKKVYIGSKSFWDCNGSSNQAELSDKLSRYMIRKLKETELNDITINRQVLPIKISTSKSMIPERNDFIRTLMKARSAIAKAKAYYTIKLVQDLIDEGKSVVVYSSFLDAIDLISKSFKLCTKIVGSQKYWERDLEIKKFQQGESNVCVISTSAGATGITLTKSSTLIFNDIDLVPSTIRQCEGRILRLSQKEHIVNIYYMLAHNSPVDSYIYELVDKKTKNINAIIDKRDISNELFEKLISENLI